ncbi:efflux RND transporter permease subunit [Mesohalobacter halotolerans]|uniref:Efflux RND transporter permease subunit n=1 Tax=Mesohalobacter halotolerans TaxID=1883405 RepID=A0A4U5TR34_9FLAO|nr:efflux RND transporter permease subunit [Mesohalobacter halotolerans]MBS3739475.1 efflux RND transporter permease subunit [Psychroflexus sp.]TKS56687.1 efflux RND transporter permease subunit [Mesohalobacter halotolerans]
MSENQVKKDQKDIFFVRRPIVAIVIAIFMVIIGGVSILGLAVEQYPNITPPVVRVSTFFTGANSTTVENSVAAPLEQQINGVENMLYMKSTNANDGSMSLEITFDLGTDPDMNTVFTQNSVATATPKLPEAVKRIGVTTKKSMSSILMLLSVTSPNGTYDKDFLGNYSIINIQDQLARIKGVGRVQVLGSSNYSMRIWVKPDKLAKLDISIPEIMNAIREQNVVSPGGQIGAEPAPKGTEFTYTVRLPDQLVDESEFENIVIRTRPDGSQLLMKDIAEIKLGTENYNSQSRTNGKDAAAIAIYQSPGTNAVTLAEEVISAMDNMAESFPEDITYDVSLDATEPIMAGIHEIIETLIIALILVILVVFLFIQDWRATLIPTLAIPVSLIATFMFFPILDFTVNSLSLLGLVLAIGIVVDDAIVVVEAVQVNIEKGMNPKTATTAAMKEVSGPIIATTLVMIAVFVPVAAMAGITGSLYQQFAITIAVSVVFSSINALTLSPALCALIMKKPTESKGALAKFFNKFNKVFDRGTRKYGKATAAISGKLKRGVVYLFITVIASGIFGFLVPGGFLPEEDQGYYFVNVQLPNAASLQRTDAVVQDIEDLLMDDENVEYATAISGYSLLSGAMIPNNAFIFVKLVNWDERELTANEAIAKTNATLNKKILSAQAMAFGPPAIPGLGNGSGFSIMIQDKKGQSPAYLAEQTYKFIAEAQKRPEVASAFTTFQAKVPQRRMILNKDKILKSNVALADVYNTFAAFLGGAYVNDFTKYGRSYKAYVQAEPEYRQSEKGLELFYVQNKDGVSIPLSTFVDVVPDSGPDYTTRFNLLRAAEVTGQPASGYSSAQTLTALEEVADEVLPSDMTYSWNAMSYQEKKSSGQLSIVFAFSLFFVFLILAAQYESWSMPLAILLGTPFALMGAFGFLYIARLFSESYLTNIFAQISLVMLIAMAAKNAILIVEFAKIKFDEGLSLFDAAVEAAILRFRPILMTTFAFILGVLPLLLASGAGAEARKVMGVALLGGMGVATAIGVLMYPMLFVLIGKLAGYEKNRNLQPKNDKHAK